MRRSKTNKPSSSTFKPQAATPRPQARTSRPSPAFSLLQYPFAIPLGLRNLLRLAAVMVLLAQLPVQAEGGSVWKADSSRSMFADKRAGSVGDIITILIQENTTAQISMRTNKTTRTDDDGALHCNVWLNRCRVMYVCTSGLSIFAGKQFGFLHDDTFSN